MVRKSENSEERECFGVSFSKRLWSFFAPLVEKWIRAIGGGKRKTGGQIPPVPIFYFCSFMAFICSLMQSIPILGHSPESVGVLLFVFLSMESGKYRKGIIKS